MIVQRSAGETIDLSDWPDGRLPAWSTLIACTITGSGIVRLEMGAWWQRNATLRVPLTPPPAGTPVYVIAQHAVVMGCTLTGLVTVEYPAGVSGSFLPADWDDPDQIIVADEPDELEEEPPYLKRP